MSPTLSHAAAPETDDFQEEIRQVIVRTRRRRPYSALFVIRAEVVHILRGADRGSARYREKTSRADGLSRATEIETRLHQTR
jgi:hypothetical protein